MTSGHLEQLGRTFGTDKVSHGYLPHYADRFERLPEEPTALLEIGVFEGASLKMWSRFFPRAKIVGIDIAPQWISDPLFPNVTTCIGNQNDVAFLESVGEAHGPFDIIIDDGSHRGADHPISFAVLFDYLRPGGWYVIEDLHSLWNPYWTEPNKRTILDFRLTPENILIGGDSIQEFHLVGGNWDDGLLFIRKRWTPYRGEHDAAKSV